MLNTSRAQSLGSQAQVAFANKDFNTAMLLAYQSNQIRKNDAADLVLGQLPYENFSGGKQFGEHTGTVLSVAWSADGQLASAASHDQRVIIWDLQTGQPAQTLMGHTDWVESVAWSADGRLASASRDDTVIIWDLQSGQPAQTLQGHTDWVRSVAWSADGQLASASHDDTVIIWDLQSGQPAQTLMGYTGVVLSVAWSADGQLASASEDQTIKIARGTLLPDISCDNITRNMSTEEWIKFQSVFYIYQPACSNLYDPSNNINPLINPLDSLITWKGRAFMFVALLVVMAILILIIRFARKIIMKL